MTQAVMEGFHPHGQQPVLRVGTSIDRSIHSSSSIVATGEAALGRGVARKSWVVGGAVPPGTGGTFAKVEAPPEQSC